MSTNKNYIIKSRDLWYRKNTTAKPLFVYVILILLNKVPKRYIGIFTPIFRILRLKCTFQVLNRKLRFYLHSNLYDFKYHAGGIHELRISENFLRLMPDDSIFFDVGCSVGWYAILVAEKCKRVIGFDPYDTSSVMNIRLNGIKNFELHPIFFIKLSK